MGAKEKGKGKGTQKSNQNHEMSSEAANLDVFFFLDFGHFLVLLET